MLIGYGLAAFPEVERHLVNIAPGQAGKQLQESDPVLVDLGGYVAVLVEFFRPEVLERARAGAFPGATVGSTGSGSVR